MRQEYALELIAVRYKEAAKLIEECRKIANENGLSLDLPDMNLREDYFKDGNWQSSSYNC